MKGSISLVFVMMLSLFGFAQSSDEKSGLFTSLDPYDQLSFDINIDLCNNVNQNDSLVLLNAIETSTFKVDIDALNTKLFSNINIIENTYLDQNKFLRGCGYLEDGVTNPVDSAGLMFSLVLNNFVNNVVFKDRGPLTRLFYPKN